MKSYVVSIEGFTRIFDASSGRTAVGYALRYYVRDPEASTKARKARRKHLESDNWIRISLRRATAGEAEFAAKSRVVAEGEAISTQ